MQSIKKLLVVMMVSFFVMANMAVPAGAVVTDFANKVSIPQNTIVIIIDESGTEVYKGACEEKKEEGQEDDQCSALLLDLPKGTYTVKTLDGSVIGKVTVSTMSPLTVIGGVLLTGTAIGIAVDNDSSSTGTTTTTTTSTNECVNNAGTYTCSPDGCGIGSVSSPVVTVGATDVTSTPFGTNGAQTFTPDSPVTGLTILGVGAHTCTFSCEANNQILVTCTNAFGGSCTSTCTK